MRALKKIVALATGATMLGATVMGAMAANLADYPKPFVDGCTFSGALVVGDADTAKVDDVIGAVDIASTLAVSGTAVSGTGGTTISSEGESIKIETGVDKLNVGDLLVSVKTTKIDDDDLPTILADGTYKNGESTEYKYEQTVQINNSVQFTHFSDSDYKNKEPTLGIFVSKGRQILNYTLDFTKAAESDVVSGDLDDIEDTDINMLGKTYDIVEVDNASSNLVDGKIKLQMMSGSIKDVLEQGQIKTYTIGGKDYDVEVVYIGGTTSEVKFKVNGETTKALREDQTFKTADGTQIGVRELLEEEAGEVTADQVEFYIGAEKLTIENTEKLELNDVDVDDIECIVRGTFASGQKVKIEEWQLQWKAKDDIFVTKEQSVTMPGIEAIKLSYEGLTTKAEETTELRNNGDRIVELRTTLKSGDVTIPVLGSNGTHFLRIGGDDTDEWLRTAPNASSTIVYDKDTDDYFVATYWSGAAGESYLLEVTDVDDGDGVDFKDVANGVKYENKRNTTAGTGPTFSIGSVTLTVNWAEESNNSVSVTAGANVYFDRLATKEGLMVYLPYNSSTATTAAASAPGYTFINLSGNGTGGTQPTTYLILMKEEDKDGNINGGGNITVQVGHTSSKEVQVSDTTYLRTNLSGANVFEIGDTDEYVGYMASDLGSKILYDQAPDQDSLKIIYHGEQTYGNVYISEVAARFSETVGGAETGVCKVTVPAALLASEVEDVTADNLILVGGPCANAAAATVMGVAGTWPACGEGFEEGKAKIKLYEQTTGKVAMLVAGMTALDTRRASRVLKNYGDYALTGDEVEVTGTTLTDISVSAVTE